MGKPVMRAILDGAQQIATPAFVSTLVHLHRLRAGRLHHRRRAGTSSRRSRWRSCSRCSRATSSRAPSCRRWCSYLLAGRGAPAPRPGTRHVDGGRDLGRAPALQPPLRAASQAAYRGAARLGAPRTAGIVVGGFAAFVGGVARHSSRCSAWTSSPTVDAGQFRLHVRCPAGTRIEETERRFAEVEEVIRETIPADEIDMVHRQHRDSRRRRQPGVHRRLDRLGGRRRDPGRAESGAPRSDRRLRRSACARSCASGFPISTFFFQPADIVGADPELRAAGADRRADRRPRPEEPGDRAMTWCVAIAPIPGAVDVRLQQVRATRRRSTSTWTAGWRGSSGFTRARTSPRACSSRSRASAQSAPNYWLNLTERRELSSRRADARSTASTRSTRSTARRSIVPGQPRRSSSPTWPRTRRTVAPSVISHYNVQPVLDVLAGVQRRRPVVGRQRRSSASSTRSRPTLPRGTFITIRGQAESMRTSFTALGVRACCSPIVLVYLLMAVNFQSWIDPLIILMALAGRDRGRAVDAVRSRRRTSPCRR